jgi:Protein of unknown function (DUF3298).
MKRFAVYLTISHLTFTCGLAAASLWNGTTVKPKHEQAPFKVLKQARMEIPPPPPPAVNSTSFVKPHREVIFGNGRLKIVPHQIRLRSDRLRYEIDVSYPEIVGSNDPQIEKLNRHLRKLATDQYQWPMHPSEADLRFYKNKHPEASNTVDLDYEIRLATDSQLSIFFIGYNYGIGAAHSVQYSFTVNYDLTLRKELSLSDLFKAKSKYLEFIAGYCREELSKKLGGFLFDGALSARAQNFDNWNLTPSGIAFNFDACKLTGCAAGKQEVEIPFSALQPWLNSRTLDLASKAL